MSQFTPGPWGTEYIFGQHVMMDVDARVVICAAPKSVLHNTTKIGEAAYSRNNSPYHVDNRAEAEANARLMAAAPDMHSLLRELLNAGLPQDVTTRIEQLLDRIDEVAP